MRTHEVTGQLYCIVMVDWKRMIYYGERGVCGPTSTIAGEPLLTNTVS